MRKGAVVRLTCTLNLKVYRKGRKGGSRRRKRRLTEMYRSPPAFDHAV